MWKILWKIYWEILWQISHPTCHSILWQIHDLIWWFTKFGEKFCDSLNWYFSTFSVRTHFISINQWKDLQTVWDWSTCNIINTCNVVSTCNVLSTFKVVSTCNVVSTYNIASGSWSRARSENLKKISRIIEKRESRWGLLWQQFFAWTSASATCWPT